MLLCGLFLLLLIPARAQASYPDLPGATLFAPRGQTQDAGVLAVSCTNENSSLIGDSFQVGWPPVRARRGAQLVLRFERPEQPSEVKIRGPRSLRPFTLEPYAPAGTVEAWDARFAAPGRPPARSMEERDGKRYYAIVAVATWYGDEDCTVSKTGEWALSLQPPR